MRRVALTISGLCVLEALCYAWMGWAAYSLFRSAGASASQAFAVAEDEWTTGLLILIGGIIHYVAPKLRLPLAVAGVLGGLYAAYFLIKSSSMLVSWNLLNGDIISLGKWSETILIALGAACVVELVMIATGRDKTAL